MDQYIYISPTVQLHQFNKRILHQFTNTRDEQARNPDKEYQQRNQQYQAIQG